MIGGREETFEESNKRLRSYYMVQRTDFPVLFLKNDTKRSDFPRQLAEKVWEDMKNGDSNYFIHGDTGKCKSRIAYLGCLKYWTNAKHGRLPVIYGSGELSTEISSAWMEGRNGYDHIVYRAGGCSMLLIDDLGKEPFTERYKHFLFSVLDKRMNGELPTIITSQYSPEEICSHWGKKDRPALERRFDQFYKITKV